MKADDVISRQAAIDACLNGWNKDYKEIVKEIRVLPSVTPAEKQEPCDDAKKYFKIIYELSQTLGVSYDFIDEKIKEIIPALKKPSISEDGTLTVNVEDGSKVSRVLVCGDNHFGGLYYPEQEPCKVGHWISNAEDDLKISDYTCSNCKGLSDEDSDYCPKCGSYNGGVK